MENCFESPQEKANFQDNGCRTEKFNESYLILKQKICRSHELIRQYNDKLKECERLKADLAAANKEVKKMTANYNASLAKVIKIELQNTGYKKNVEELESKISKYESKMVADQRHVQQLICKMKDMDGKHSDRIIKYDLQISALHGKVKELEQELKATKKLYGPKAKKSGKDISDADEDENAEKKSKIEPKTTVDVGINTARPWPVPAVKAQSIDACTLTDEFYNTSDNPYPLFCQKCEVLLHPPPLEKICRIMKECPRIVEKFMSSPPAVPDALPRIPPVTPPPSASPNQPISFPQTVIRNNPPHSTPISLPPPPSSPVMDKVVDQRPLVRMLMKRVNRLETKIDAQHVMRNQPLDNRCRPVCLGDTISSVSEFLQEVTRIARRSGKESRRCRETRETRVRVIRSHILKPKITAARRRLPVVASCSGSWQVNSLKKVQREKGNKVRKRDMRKLFGVNGQIEKTMQRRMPAEAVAPENSLHSLSESEVSDSVNSGDDNERKVNDSIPAYDEDSSSDENGNDDEKGKDSDVEKNPNLTQTTTFNRDSTSVDDEKAIEDCCDRTNPDKEILDSDRDINDAKIETASNKNKTVSNVSNKNSCSDIELPPTCSEITIEQDVNVSNKTEKNLRNTQASLPITDETQRKLIEETSVLSDRFYNNLCTSDDDDDMSPPIKIIRLSDTPASPDENVNEYTKTKDPVTIPTECTISVLNADAKSLNSTEYCAMPECLKFKVDSGKITSQAVLEIDSATEDVYESYSNKEYALLAQNDVTVKKVCTPFRPILVPTRRIYRHIKIENNVQSENFRQSTDVYRRPNVISENMDSKCCDSGEASNDATEEERMQHDQSEDGTNEDSLNVRIDATAHRYDNGLQRIRENGNMSESMERNDSVELITPMNILRSYVEKKALSGKSKQSQKIKKKKKLRESMELTNTFVKKQFQRLIDSGWQLTLHDDVIEKLSKTCGARVIAKLAVEFLCELTSNNKKLDRTHTPPAPLMTKAQQRMITLIVDLDSIKPGVIRYLQAGIQYKLFRLNCAPEREVVESLGRIYTVLARILKDREILRIFCCDALYCLGLNAISIIYTVLTCWPEVFPARRENGDILPKCIAHLILQQQAAVYFPKLLPLKNLITGLYTYSPTQLIKTDLLRELLSSLENANQNGLYTAIILFAKKEGPVWTYKNIVRDGLLPMIIGQRHPCVYAAFCLLGNLMRSFPVADPDGTVGEIVDQLCDLMNSGEGSDEQQQGVASALLSLSRHKFHSVAQSVLAWQPKSPLKPKTTEQLRVLFNSKPIDFWRSFIKKACLDHCMNNPP